MEKVIISGFGGQGVLFVGKLLAYTGMVTNRHVSWIPSYGPEMRGGTANCSVIISGREITSPIVNECTTLIAFNEPSIEKFAPVIEMGGKLLFDASLIHSDKPEAAHYEWNAIPTLPIIEHLGLEKSFNMIMLGAFIESTTIITLEDIEKGLIEMVGGKRPELIENNMKAIKEGYNWRNWVSTHA
jgi:2-oxoglutarate ferredoxin oxidoreductase subunit gamma